MICLRFLPNPIFSTFSRSPKLISRPFSYIKKFTISQIDPIKRAKFISNTLSTLKKSGNIPKTIALYKEHLNILDDIHYAIIFSVFERGVKSPADARKLREGVNFKKILDNTMDKLNHSNPPFFRVRQLSAIAHALSKVQSDDRRIFDYIVEVSERALRKTRILAMKCAKWLQT
tara:strand:- start:300 stop:821 length:522 start_codon:yes stop_codon:yes gene_type:complete